MRLKDLQSQLVKSNIDIAVFLSLDSLRYDENLFYFTGFEGIGALIVPKKRPAFLIAPALDLQRAKKSGIKVLKWEKGKKLFELINELLKKQGIKPRRVALDKNNVSLNVFKSIKKTFKNIKTQDISGVCFELREVKTKEEINNIRKACSITDEVLNKCITRFKSFKTEAEVAAFLECEIYKQGCDISFKPIVASGKNSSMPHHTPRNIKLNKGFCIIDFGAKYKGYCADITRTLYLGTPKKEEEKIYNLLLNIQKDTIKRAKAGIECQELFNFVSDSLGEYKDKFIHGLGHGLGVYIHELPNLKPGDKNKIKKGTAVTIEPGIYFPNKFGIRIEDTILVDDKTEKLTKTKKKMVVIR